MTAPGPDAVPALIVLLKAVVEFAAFLLMARAGVWLVCFGRVQANTVHQGLRFLTRPVEALARPLLGKTERPAAAAWVGGAVLALAWVGLVWAKAVALGHA